MLATAGPPAGPPGRLDLPDLAASVQSYFQAGLAPATHRSYQAALKRFHEFCTHYNICNPFPLTEHTLCYFTAYLADKGLAPQTGKSYLSAVRSMQISLGFPDPREQSSLPILKRVQAGISRLRMSRGSPPRIRLPVTAQILSQIRQTLAAATSQDRLAIWAIAAVAFFGFFRLGELLPESAHSFNPATDLAWGDIAVDSHSTPTMLQIHLKKSKCDQAGRGADIVIGRTGCKLCPVSAVLHYITARGDQAGPFFINSSKETITKAWFVARIRELLGSIGLPQHQYAGHSFRIGAATTAAMAGVEDSMIQTLGRWHSAAFLQYIRTPKEHLAAVSAVMGRTAREPGGGPSSRTPATSLQSART